MIAAALLLAAAAPCPPVSVDAHDRQDAVVESRAAEHRAIRGALSENAPSIWLFAGGGHLVTEQYSIVATRGAGGGWQVDRRGRSQIWIADAPWSPEPTVNGQLSPEAAQRLDAILADPCFWAEPAHLSALTGDEPPPLGIMVVTLEVFMPGHVRRAVIMGRAAGLTGELERLVTP